MLKKIMSGILCTLLSLGVFTSYDVFAQTSEEVYEYEHIPVKMLPNSVIEFVDDTHYVILQGGTVEDEADYYRNGVPKPKKGLVVTYAQDGFILDADFPEDVVDPYSDVEVDEHGIELYAYIFDGEEYDKIATWGANYNTLYQAKYSNKMIGSGRATTFSDTIGCYGNTLVKGDIALKMEYDNCPNGVYVSVNLQKNGGGSMTKNMKKADRGGMPDAIVDVWKTGVEYWGYTYSSTFSFPGIATIKYTGSFKF